MTDDEMPSTLPPWLNTGFDWEGVVAAVAAFLIALLLGWLWAPLFWIGFVLAIVALLGARWSKRSPPDLADAILAPCDGVVVSVAPAEAPHDLHMGTSRSTRVRIASGPAATNKLYSPIHGGIGSLNVEPGDPSVPFATRPDENGLAVANVIFESQDDQVGVRFLTGGLGPRLEFNVAQGDVVRSGRVLGTRRLGGWCDVYVPEAAGLAVWPGQTLVGGETVIGRFSVDTVDADFETVAETDVEFSAPHEDEAEDDRSPLIEERAEPDAIDELFEEDDYPEPDQVEQSDDPAVIFARIREASRKHGESD